jgi:FdhD protein
MTPLDHTHRPLQTLASGAGSPAQLRALTSLKGDRSYEDLLVTERALEVWVQGAPYATLMCTPGADEALAVGFLLSAGVIEERTDVQALTPCARDPEHRLHVWLASGVSSPHQAPRAHYSSSSCGLCSLESRGELLTRLPSVEPITLSADQVRGSLEALEAHTPLFHQTGGCHGALLIDPQGTPRVSFEDVGRHNALDKLIGHALLQGWSGGVRGEVKAWGLAGWHVVITSRAGFEVAHKAVMAGVSGLICLGAASTLAHEAARATGLTLISFARPQRAHRH